VGERTITLLIRVPAAVHLPPIECQSLVVPGSPGVFVGQRIPFLFITSNLFFQFVNLATGASLLAIEATRI
jgi:hypothetical protein